MNKIDKPLVRLIKEKRENNHINKNRIEKGEVTTDNAEIQRSIRDYYEQLYGNKMDNQEEMDRFLEKFNISTTQLQALKLKLSSKSPKKQKPKTRWLHRRILANI